jgi:hypothetical protein
MMKNTKAFSLSKALPAAFQRLWEQNLEDRAAGRDYRGHTYYVTATDLERQVRAFACDSKAGRAWSTHWRDSYGTSRISLNRGPRYTLLDAVREWLFTQVRAGRLERNHNNGRGHISGEKFRPAGEPLSPAERRGDVARAKRAEAPVHVYGQNFQLICRKPTKARSVYSRRGGRSKTRKTSDASRVTCSKCLKLMAAPGWVNYWDKIEA